MKDYDLIIVPTIHTIKNIPNYNKNKIKTIQNIDDILFDTLINFVSFFISYYLNKDGPTKEFIEFLDQCIHLMAMMNDEKFFEFLYNQQLCDWNQTTIYQITNMSL